jgi:predicted ribosomally synthesized peptide with nif11-like leader
MQLAGYRVRPIFHFKPKGDLMSLDQARLFIERMKSDEAFAKRVMAIEDVAARLACIQSEGFACENNHRKTYISYTTIAPHIHAYYQEFKAIIDINNCELSEGKLSSKQMKLALAWAEIHKEELLADWELASNGELPFPIKPLQ